MLFFLAECGSLWQFSVRFLPNWNIILAETRGILAETRGVLAVCKLFLAVFGSFWQPSGKNKKEITILFLIGYWHFLIFYFNQTAKILIFLFSGTFSIFRNAPECDIVSFLNNLPGPAGIPGYPRSRLSKFQAGSWHRLIRRCPQASAACWMRSGIGIIVGAGLPYPCSIGNIDDEDRFRAKKKPAAGMPGAGRCWLRFCGGRRRRWVNNSNRKRRVITGSCSCS